MKIRTIVLASLLLVNTVFAWQVQKVLVEEELDLIKLPNKLLKLDVGIGSGAYHYKGDKDNIFYTITDRGVNIKCKDSKKLMGKKLCEKGKIFPTQNFTPTIYKIQLFDNFYKILKKIQIKDRNGNQVSGISNEGTEKAFDIQGNVIPYDANGLDAEALVRLSDGSFWIAEEYGASLLHIAFDGKIIKRVVPQGFEKNLSAAKYDISSSLPKIISKRPLNRGIESLALSKDEKFLYFSMQSPLANPSKKAYTSSNLVRMFKYNIKKDEVVGEYIYKIDTADSFSLDNKTKQNAVKISEMVNIGDDEFIILERVSKTTKFYKVKFENSILHSKWDDINTSPSLEENNTLESMEKTLVLDTSTLKNMPKKIEGIAYIDENNWILVNDNDFGIKKDKTYIIKLSK